MHLFHSIVVYGCTNLNLLRCLKTRGPNAICGSGTTFLNMKTILIYIAFYNFKVSVNSLPQCLTFVVLALGVYSVVGSFFN